MKKVLLTTAALGLGLALTATVASAASFSAAGKANLTGIYLNHGDSSSAGFKAGVLDDPTDENVDGWHQSYYFYPKVMINDNSSIQGELRFIDRQVLGDGHSASDEYMRVFKLWANYVSPVGTLSFGRMPAGTWGSKFLDSTGNADRIKFATDVGAVSVYALYQKNEENDAYEGSSDEDDAASYLAGVSFGNDMGKTDLAVWYTKFDQDNGDYTNTELWFNGVYNFGAINLAAEAKYAMGEDSNQDDISSFAAMLNASTNIDTMTAGVLFFYGQGDDESDGDNNGYTTRKGFGNDFNPFLIATGDYFGVLNGDKNPYLSSIDWQLGGNPGSGGVTGNGDNPGAIALAAYLVVPVNDQLTVNAAAGHIWADKDFGLDNKIGWEVDFGMSYKLLDNLVYSASVGFMKPGKMIDDFSDVDAQGGWTDGTNSIIALVHSLTMTF